MSISISTTPDLSHTVTDSDTGEVLHRGMEGAQREEWRKKRDPDWKRFYEERDQERRESQPE